MQRAKGTTGSESIGPGSLSVRAGLSTWIIDRQVMRSTPVHSGPPQATHRLQCPLRARRGPSGSAMTVLDRPPVATLRLAGQVAAFLGVDQNGSPALDGPRPRLSCRPAHARVVPRCRPVREEDPIMANATTPVSPRSSFDARGRALPMTEEEIRRRNEDAIRALDSLDEIGDAEEQLPRPSRRSLPTSTRNRSPPESGPTDALCVPPSGPRARCRFDPRRSGDHGRGPGRRREIASENVGHLGQFLTRGHGRRSPPDRRRPGRGRPQQMRSVSATLSDASRKSELPDVRAVAGSLVHLTDRIEVDLVDPARQAARGRTPASESAVRVLSGP